jgi:hypothetical protein
MAPETSNSICGDYTRLQLDRARLRQLAVPLAASVLEPGSREQQTQQQPTQQHVPAAPPPQQQQQQQQQQQTHPDMHSPQRSMQQPSQQHREQLVSDLVAGMVSMGRCWFV